MTCRVREAGRPDRLPWASPPCPLPDSEGGQTAGRTARHRTVSSQPRPRATATSGRNAPPACALARGRLGVRGPGGRAAAHSYVGRCGACGAGGGQHAGRASLRLRARLRSASGRSSLLGSPASVPQPHPTVLGAHDPPSTEAEAHSQNPEEKQPGEKKSAADTGYQGLLRPARTGARRHEPTGSRRGNNVGCEPAEAERPERQCTRVRTQL